jgi:hypothetical protein
MYIKKASPEVIIHERVGPILFTCTPNSRFFITFNFDIAKIPSTGIPYFPKALWPYLAKVLFSQSQQQTSCPYPGISTRF